VNNWKIAEPLSLDGMPVEVATEMLASPRAKLTSRQRKTCMAARQRVFETENGAPITRRVLNHTEPIFVTRRATRHFLRHAKTLKTGLFFDADFSPALPEAKLDRKFSTLLIAKLATLRRRAIRNRARVQYAYAKLAGDESKQAIKLRRALDIAAAHHELIQDCANTAITVRLSRATSGGPKPHYFVPERK
jgi:hypothetical protein